MTVLVVIPSGVWRTAVGLGVPLGWSDAHLRQEHIPGDGTSYVISLTVLSLCAAWLTLGLIHGWGENVPPWVPRLGGRRIPPLLAVVPAITGAVFVMVLGVISVVRWDNVSGFAENPNSGWAAVMVVCYAPALLWGPLLIAVTVAYWRRRRSGATTNPDPAHNQR